MVPGSGLTGRYFLPMTTGITKVTSHMMACAVAKPIPRWLLNFCWYLLVQVGCSCGTVLQFEFIVDEPSCCVAVSFICCGTAVSSTRTTRTTAFSCCGFIFIYICACPGAFHATEEDTAQHGCVIGLLPYFSLNIPFCYAYHFIHICCVFHMYIIIAVFNGQQ